MDPMTTSHGAGRHLVVGASLLRGYKAKVVGRTTHIEVNGRPAQVQIAGTGAWQIADVDMITSEMTDQPSVLVNVTDGAREFYICPGDELRSQVRRNHDSWLAEHGGQRPRTPDSKHHAIQREHVAAWRDNWDLLA
jgi:hypothetical protein